MSTQKKKHEENLPVVQEKKNTALSLLPEIDFAADMEEFGANYSQEQMALPFLLILQALSPQVSRGKEEYLEAARSGMFFNTVTKDLYDGEKGINLILSNFKESYIEWVPRTKGGGFIKEYDTLTGSQIKTLVDPQFNNIIQEGSSFGTPGNLLSLTHTRLGGIVKDDLSSWTPVVISMSASGVRVSRNLNARHKVMEWTNPATGQPGPLGKLPMPLILWTLKTKPVSNDQGSWFTWDFEKKSFLYDLPPEDFVRLYRSVRDFATSAKGKKAMEEAASASVTINQKQDNISDEIPF